MIGYKIMALRSDEPPVELVRSKNLDKLRLFLERAEQKGVHYMIAPIYDDRELETLDQEREECRQTIPMKETGQRPTNGTPKNTRG